MTVLDDYDDPLRRHVIGPAQQVDVSGRQRSRAGNEVFGDQDGRRA
jgi:hypothetical protein